jgi:hypothetical protein
VPRFVERVIQRRRAEASAEPPAADGVATPENDTVPADEPEGDHESRIATLERRIEHLEALVEGLQDAVHRETVRQQRDIGELERRTEAGEMARSLDRHARERGL